MIKEAQRVSMETSYGRIIAEIFVAQAPATARNFLHYVDLGLYESASFYRAVRPDIDERSPRIQVLQGGIDRTCRNAPLPPVMHESTDVTGLRHVDGALSAVRWEPGSASSEFFIVIDDTPELDFSGKRNPDGQGFAVFGQVITGMEIVRRINARPTGTDETIGFLKNQALLPPDMMRVTRWVQPVSDRT